MTPTPFTPAAAADVRGIAVDRQGHLWAATAAGPLVLPPGERTWSSPGSPGPLAPSFCVAAGDTVWLGAWDGLYRGDARALTPIDGVPGPVSALATRPDGRTLAGGPFGFFLFESGHARRVELGATRYLSRLSPGPGSTWDLATGMGAFEWDDRTPSEPGRYLRGPYERHSVAVRGLVRDVDGRFWVAALGGLQVFRGTRLEREITAADGLPSADVRCVARGPDGRLWVGTARGLARSTGGDGWSVRQGRRWLVHDEVRDLAFDGEGTAWVATAGGVSALRTRHLTLADKAAQFHGILEARHVRPPGIVEKCQFRTPGDLSTWGPMDDDNDGGYTALALAMESYRFAATGDPAALTAARRAFAACQFLQRVTGTPGFLARTVVPADWTEVHDPNRVLDPPAQAEELARDPRDKYVPVRWRPSADGRWRWKGDTSSDEITAHFYGYFVFHEMAAQEADRRAVREQVCRIADHLLEHGFVLQDQDGRPTRWGIWAPERLNSDPDWAMERGINSTELLSYLKVAYHVSGDARYNAAYRRLIDEHHYDRNVLEAPNLNPAWRTYIDLELLAFAYPALLSLERDPALLRTYRRSFERWHTAVRADGNPFFEFLYAVHGQRRRANLDGARTFLRDTPLDLVRWDLDLGQREDLRPRRWPEVERWQVDRLPPPSELAYSRTDQNPWHREQGEGGRTESDGVFWLLPYWMGRHHGLLP